MDEGQLKARGEVNEILGQMKEQYGWDGEQLKIAPTNEAISEAGPLTA